MYFELECNGIDLEYMDENVTIYNNKTKAIIHGYNINNLVVILTNLFPGVLIRNIVMDDVVIKQTINNITINNSLIINESKIDNLITIIRQAANLRAMLVRPKKPDEPRDKSKVENPV